jgi:hypothetical protein
MAKLKIIIAIVLVVIIAAVIALLTGALRSSPHVVSSSSTTTTVQQGKAGPLNAQVYPHNATVSPGQSVILTGTATGGVTPYSYQWYSGASPECSSDSPIGGATSFNYPAVPAASTYYCYTVTDSAHNTAASPTVLVTVT